MRKIEREGVRQEEEEREESSLFGFLFSSASFFFFFSGSDFFVGVVVLFYLCVWVWAYKSSLRDSISRWTPRGKSANSDPIRT